VGEVVRKGRGMNEAGNRELKSFDDKFHKKEKTRDRRGSRDRKRRDTVIILGIFFVF
jgi:hypothetical protein